MKGKNKRKLIKQFIETTVFFSVILGSTALLIFSKTNMQEFIIIVSGISILALNAFLPDRVLWEIEFKKRCEKY